ncbi:hypothetical protein [Paraclostridium bifermentans]|uniref:hypothetical protein n=1 Tax=Paraclostridium bifermentans TaxID=1490 RepID=UPI0025B0BFCA|nr:hypothetical protein [Paraclostridium bifermentans]
MSEHIEMAIARYMEMQYRTSVTLYKICYPHMGILGGIAMELKLLTKGMFLLEMKSKSPLIDREEAEKQWDKISKGFNYIFKYTNHKTETYVGVIHMDEYLR